MSSPGSDTPGQTQNSLPSGSAIGTHSRPSPCPTSMRVAPRASKRSTSPRTSKVRKSMWTRVFTVFGSAPAGARAGMAHDGRHQHDVLLMASDEPIVESSRPESAERPGIVAVDHDVEIRLHDVPPVERRRRGRGHSARDLWDGLQATSLGSQPQPIDGSLESAHAGARRTEHRPDAQRTTTDACPEPAMWRPARRNECLEGPQSSPDREKTRGAPNQSRILTRESTAPTRVASPCTGRQLMYVTRLTRGSFHRDSERPRSRIVWRYFKKTRTDRRVCAGSTAG